MPDIQEESISNVEDRSSFPTGSASSAESLPFSVSEGRSSDQPKDSGITLIVRPISESTVNPLIQEDCSPSTPYTSHDIETLIGSCGLKSEEITSLVAEKLPSSESDEYYDLFRNPATWLRFKMEDNQPIPKTNVRTLCPHKELELDKKIKQDGYIMRSWLTDGSEDSSILSSYETAEEQLLKCSGDESEMEKLGKTGTAKGTSNANSDEQPFASDLINLNECPEETSEMHKNVERQDKPFVPTSENAENSKLDFNLKKEQFARNYMDNFKDVLNSVLQNEKNIFSCEDGTHDTGKSDEASGHSLKRVERDPQDDAEVNFLKVRIPRGSKIAETGLPKRNITNSVVNNRHEDFVRNIKKIWTFSKRFNTIHADAESDSDFESEEDYFMEIDGSDAGYEEIPQMSDTVVSSNATSGFQVQCELMELISDNAALSQSQESTDEKERADTKNVDEFCGEAVDEDTSEKSNGMNVKNNDSEKKPGTMVIKSILKNHHSSQKHVTFVEKEGGPGMEHMGVEQEKESAKLREKLPDLDTALRFMTEVFPCREDDEILSESLSATLEPGAFARTRKDSPREAELYEKLKILEVDDSSNKQQKKTISRKSPEKSELPDSTIKEENVARSKQTGRFSRFFKWVRKRTSN